MSGFGTGQGGTAAKRWPVCRPGCEWPSSLLEQDKRGLVVQAWMLSMHSEDELLQRSTDHVNDRGTCFRRQRD